MTNLLINSLSSVFLLDAFIHCRNRCSRVFSSRDFCYLDFLMDLASVLRLWGILLPVCSNQNSVRIARFATSTVPACVRRATNVCTVNRTSTTRSQLTQRYIVTSYFGTKMLSAPKPTLALKPTQVSLYLYPTDIIDLTYMSPKI